ncbi:hypothetical protein [Streptomyces coffeae]|uniref:Uncharacterized protein n=1 Tax=Streptomyces coffeae TaxID=621382 RepID=A0ABS1NIZ5_9ACTN|nr:hypothetical protein [Streptomyces coffeae]MBL1100092.1 hypothetical protein [Streptomyces coffeae]
MSTSSQTQPDEKRAAYVAGLRALADFMEATPSLPVPSIDQRFLLPLHTNAAVEAFAAEHGLTVVYSAEGNASADLVFGPMRYHAYGYVDFIEHCDRTDERSARAWAERKGMEIRPVESTAAVSA